MRKNTSKNQKRNAITLALTLSFIRFLMFFIAVLLSFNFFMVFIFGALNYSYYIDYEEVIYDFIYGDEEDDYYDEYEYDFDLDFDNYDKSF